MGDNQRKKVAGAGLVDVEAGESRDPVDCVDGGRAAESPVAGVGADSTRRAG
jgi:hypothetical protein